MVTAVCRVGAGGGLDDAYYWSLSIYLFISDPNI